MKRRLFNLAINATMVLSLLLCVATVALWARSYLRFDQLWYTDSFPLVSSSEPPDRPKWSRGSWYDMWELSSGRGALHLYHHRSDQVGGGGSGGRLPDGWSVLSGSLTFYDATRTPLPWHGLSYARSGDAPMSPSASDWTSWAYSWELTLPHWMIALASSILPARMLYQIRRRRRFGRTGLCGVCGYDLRATPQRCPECGAVAESKAA